MLTKTKRKAGSWLKNVCLLLASSCIAFALVEWFATIWLLNFATQDQFRLYGTLKQNQERFEEKGESVSKYISHRYLGYIPSPNYKRGSNFHNDLGYRGEPIPRVKAKNEFRIVCLGGSTTYTGWVPAPSDSYPAVIERQLNERGFDHVRVINAGAEGWTSWETLVNFQFRVLDLQPDMIIIYQAVNDAIARMVWPPRAYMGDNSGFARHVPGLDRPVSLFEQSTVIRMILVQTGRWTSPLTLRNTFGSLIPTSKFWQFHRFLEGTHPGRFFEKVPVERIFTSNPPVYFRRNLETLIVTSKHYGVVPVLATFLVNLSIDDGALTAPDFVHSVEEHNDIIRELGKKFDVPVFEFAEAFPLDPDLFQGSIHLNVFGAAVKGRMFAEFLVREDLLGGASTRNDSNADVITAGNVPIVVQPS